MVTREQLEALAAQAPKPEVSNKQTTHFNGKSNSKFSLDEFLAKHSIAVKREDSYQGGRRLILEHCVFDPTHTLTSAASFELANGVLGYKCQHNGCAGKSWADVRGLFEPGYKQRHRQPASHAPRATDFDFDKFNAKAMLQEVLRRFAYLKELDNIADLDDCLIRAPSGFRCFARKYDAFEPHPEKPDKWRPVNTAERWFESPERIELVRPVYEPGLPYPVCEIDGQLYFNQWRGFAAEPRQGDVSDFLKLVDHVFEGMPEEKEHFLKFHAYARQHPGEKIMHALLLISRQQGIGKSLLGEVIGHGVWGEPNFSEVEHGHLDAAFNEHLRHKKFILANEMLLSSATSLDKRRDANLIKNAITRDRVLINEKYIRQHFTRDVLIWNLTSNFDDAVWLDRPDDRRIHISRLKQTMPLSQRYGPDFATRVKQWARSPEGAAALNYYFLHYPCDGFTAKAAPPATEGQAITYEMSLSVVERFVRGLVEDPDRLSKILNRPKLIKADLVQLSDIKQAFLLEHKDVQTISDQVLSSAISRFGGAYIPKKIQWTPKGEQKQREVRAWALRNADHWMNAHAEQRKDHYLDPIKHPANPNSPTQNLSDDDEIDRLARMDGWEPED